MAATSQDHMNKHQREERTNLLFFNVRNFLCVLCGCIPKNTVPTNNQAILTQTRVLLIKYVCSRDIFCHFAERRTANNGNDGSFAATEIKLSPDISCAEESTRLARFRHGDRVTSITSHAHARFSHVCHRTPVFVIIFDTHVA